MKRQMIFTDFVNQEAERLGVKRGTILSKMAIEAGVSKNSFFYLLTTPEINRDHHKVEIQKNGDVIMYTEKYRIPASVFK